MVLLPSVYWYYTNSLMQRQNVIENNCTNKLHKYLNSYHTCIKYIQSIGQPILLIRINYSKLAEAPKLY